MKIIVGRLQKYIYILFTVFTGLFVIKTGPIFSPDSEGYLHMSIYRSLGYPFFIFLHKALFGARYINVVLVSQVTLNLGAIFYLKTKVQRLLNLTFWKAFLFFQLLAIPLFYEIQVANGILSEAIAYPLYLIIVAHIFDFVATKNIKKIIVSGLLLLFLIQVRGQFLFLIVVLLLAVFISAKNSYTLKKQLGLIAFIVLIPFLSSGIDIGFHKLVHHKAVTTPWTGIQIATLPFFVSHEKDYLQLRTNESQEYFKHIYAQLKKNKLLLNQVPKDSCTKIDYYFANYVRIANGTLNEQGELFFKNKVPDEQCIISNDRMTSSLAVPLFFLHPLDWIKLYIQNVVKGIGNVKYILIIFFLLIFSYIKFQGQPTVPLKMIFISMVLILGNTTLVALAEPAISRYLFYNNWILLAVVLLLFDFAFNKNNK